MKTDLKSILEAAALSSCVALAGACDDGGDGETVATATDGDPGASEGCPGTSEGCPGASEGCPGTSEGCPGVDEDAIVEQALGYQSFTQANEEPITSQHMGAPVIVWVPESVAPAYEALSGFGEGDILVKEQFDAADNVAALTVMYKGPEGYSPETAGWWFGFVSPEGAIELGGQPDGCVSCHMDAAATDWVFGLGG